MSTITKKHDKLNVPRHLSELMYEIQLDGTVSIWRKLCWTSYSSLEAVLWEALRGV